MTIFWYWNPKKRVSWGRYKTQKWLVVGPIHFLWGKP